MPHASASADRSQVDPRSRILAAATQLIAVGGIEAVTTRAVGAAASVQAPTLYRLFGDKRGLIDAVVERGLANYVEEDVAREQPSDPVQDLRAIWDAHVAFGLQQPAVFAAMNSSVRTKSRSQIGLKARSALQRKIRRVAAVGRLRVSEQRAVALIHLAWTGVVVALIEVPPRQRDPGLSSAAREAVLSVILTENTPRLASGLASTASALNARLEEVVSLSPGERLLLGELLRRIADNHDDQAQTSPRSSGAILEHRGRRLRR